MQPDPIHHWAISHRVNMLKINTCKRELHESKTIERLYQKMVGSWGAGHHGEPVNKKIDPDKL